MNAVKEKKRKTRNKQIFLHELRGALKTAEAYANESGLRYSEALDAVNKNGVGILVQAHNKKMR